MMKSILKRGEDLQRLGQDLVLLFLRLLVGWQLILTGKGKLTHIDQFSTFFESLHIPAPTVHVVAIGLIEALGGFALLLGFFARGAALFISLAMIGAYLTAHRDEAFGSPGDFVDAAPFPYLTVALVVLVFGAGGISLDRARTSLLANKRQITQSATD
ncbi:DoxX family protein [Luteolibacter pohnpeiensis]|uniref:DoxX family protein n=1 Tax=Luteolibacter pohnpeiensis TaxID=454153 RepID=A0A934S6J9_9BACT|nr:DoxX family protein [Luteolibacter pohnpeiensis]MBK1883571.1 DoxX family protein [Luteolibacter pohnpeiensis]